MRSLLLVLLASCAPAAPSPPPEPAQPAEPSPSDPLEAQVRTFATEIAPYMERMGDAWSGELTARSSRDFSAFLRPGWCYKVVAAGGEGIDDLDLRVLDPNNVLLERDVRQDRRAVLGAERPICPIDNGTYRIEVRARGEGRFVVQMYQSI